MCLRRWSLSRWAAGLSLALALALAAGCAGDGRKSFISSSGTPVVPTNVAGQSDTSGVSAGSALQAATPTATPTPGS